MKFKIKDKVRVRDPKRLTNGCVGRIVEVDFDQDYPYLLDLDDVRFYNDDSLELLEESGGGKRYNDGKLPVHLVPVSLNRAVASVLHYGMTREVNPYEKRNWELGMSWETVMASLERHYLEFKSPRDSDHDSDSKLPHLYHLAANVAFLIEYMETHPELDDRVKQGKDDG